MTLTDDQFASHLQARVAAVAPRAVWDAPTVIAAARRRRALRTAGATAGVCVLAVAAALALPPALSHRASAPPADQSTQSLQPTHVDLAPGLVAAVGVEGPDTDVLLGTLAGADATLRPSGTSPGGPTGPLELALEGAAPTQSLMFSTLDGVGGAQLAAGLIDARTGTVSPTLEADPDRDVVVVAGSAPADLADARVLYYSPAGFSRPDGSMTHVVEVPTFRVPASVAPDTTDRGAWYAIELRGPAVVDLPEAFGQVLFASADGSTMRFLCQDLGAGSCPVAQAPGLTDEVRAAIGH